MSGIGRACVKTPPSCQNGCAQSDLERSSLLRSIRIREISTKIGMVSQSPEFSHRLDPIPTFGPALISKLIDPLKGHVNKHDV